MKLGRVPVVATHEDSQGVQVVESGETARKSQAGSTQIGQGESCWLHTKIARESRGWKVETQLGRARPAAHKLARESPGGST